MFVGPFLCILDLRAEWDLAVELRGSEVRKSEKGREMKDVYSPRKVLRTGGKYRNLDSY